LDEGCIYLGFNLKPNHYNVMDWEWLVIRFQKKLDGWTNQCLFMGGRMIMLKVLQNLAIYWMHLFQLPRKIIKKVQSIMGQFIWNGKLLCGKYHLVK